MSDISKINPNGTEYNLKDATARAGIESSKTVSGNPVTVTDAAPINAEDITVDITPKQDLHGYDRPWAGGAWKNRLPMTVEWIKSVNRDGTWSGNSYTFRGVTFLLKSDDGVSVTSISTSGTSSNVIYFKCGVMPLSNNNNYILSGCAASGSADTYSLYLYRDESETLLVRDIDESGISFTAASTFNSAVNLMVRTSVNMDNKVFYPMIRLSTETDPTFAPYSNICPIEGRTGAELDRVGKNWLPMTVAGIKASNTGGTWDGNTYTYRGIAYTLLTDNADNIIGVNVNGNNTGSISSDLWIPVNQTIDGILNGCPSGGSSSTYLQTVWSEQGGHVASDTGSGVSVAGIAIASMSIRVRNGVTISNKVFYPMIRSSSITDSTYEPYQGKQYTASFGETVYGGKWHVTKGGTDNDRVYVIARSNNTDGEYPLSNNIVRLRIPNVGTLKVGADSAICSHLRYAAHWDGDYQHFYCDPAGIYIYVPGSTREEAKDYLEAQYNAGTPIEICATKETPTTISTPKQNVPMLQGINTVSADCGDTSLKYQPDNVVGELKGDIEANIIYEDFKWTTQSSQSYSAGTPGTYGTSSWRDVKKEGYDVIGVTFVENRRFGDCILTLYYIPSTSHVEVIIFRATSSAVTIADEDIEYRVAYKKRT